MKPDQVKVCAAIAGIVIIEVAALLTGHDGTILSLAVGAIAGLGGFSLARLTQKA